MSLTRATVLHAPVLTALHAEGFAKAWSDDDFRALLSQPGVAAWIWHDDVPRGFILVRAVVDEAEIITIAVSPTQRRMGIGAALLKAASDELSRAAIRSLFLEVASDNTAARALYQAAGFAPFGKRAGYYQDGGVNKDAVMMKRAL